MKRITALVGLAALILALGCGGEDFAQANELESYRMIGLTGVRTVTDERPETPAADVYLDEVLTAEGVELSVAMVDFDPEGRAYTYRHTLCLSLGAPMRFECLTPESTLRCGEGVDNPMGCTADGPRAVFNLDVTTSAGLLGALGMGQGSGLPAEDGCAEMEATLGPLLEVARTGCPVTFPIPIVVRTEVIAPDGGIKLAARSVKVRLPAEFLATALAGCGTEMPASMEVTPPPGSDHECMEGVDGRPRNRNPSIESINVGGSTATEVDPATGCFGFAAAGIPGEELPISVTLSPCSAERFLTYSELSGCTVGNEADLGSAAMTFYTDGGTLLFGNRRLDSGETKLTLPLEPSQTRLYVAVRDGRNGLDIACADIETVPP